MRRALFDAGHEGFGEKQPGFHASTATRFFQHAGRVSRQFGLPAESASVRGQEAKSWPLCVLPAVMQKALEHAATRQNFPNPEAMLDHYAPRQRPAQSRGWKSRPPAATGTRIFSRISPTICPTGRI
jgi:hypothetical protein